MFFRSSGKKLLKNHSIEKIDIYNFQALAGYFFFAHEKYSEYLYKKLIEEILQKYDPTNVSI